MNKSDIQELYYFYHLNQIMIDDALRSAKMNFPNGLNVRKSQLKLDKYNKYRDKIIEQIEERLDEKFA